MFILNPITIFQGEAAQSETSEKWIVSNLLKPTSYPKKIFILNPVNIFLGKEAQSETNEQNAYWYMHECKRDHLVGEVRRLCDTQELVVPERVDHLFR